MASTTRIALIALGVACAALALALWFDGNRNDLSGGRVLLGTIALALVLVGAVATPGPPVPPCADDAGEHHVQDGAVRNRPAWRSPRRRRNEARPWPSSLCFGEQLARCLGRPTERRRVGWRRVSWPPWHCRRSRQRREGEVMTAVQTGEQAAGSARRPRPAAWRSPTAGHPVLVDVQFARLQQRGWPSTVRVSIVQAVTAIHTLREAKWLSITSRACLSPSI